MSLKILGQATESSEENKDNENMDSSESRARLHLLPSDIDVQQLESQADKMASQQRYAPALRCLTLAIDKVNMEAQIWRMKKKEKVHLIQLFAKRAECYMKIAERRRASRHAELAMHDCSFVLHTGVFEKELLDVNTELFNKLVDIEAKCKTLTSPGFSTARLENRHQHSRRRTRNRNRRAEKEPTNPMTASECEQINVTTCSVLNESNLASNASISDDQCPICFLQWSKFVEPSIAVILPCNHACCVKCLSQFKKICCQITSSSEDDYPEFTCVLCRKEISFSILHHIAEKLFDSNLAK